MKQTKSKLLTVEDTFFSKGHGVYVFPKIPIGSYSGPHRRVVTLRTPDGQETTACAQLVSPFVTPPPKELYYLCFLTGLTKDDVPIGTEIWQMRSDLQDELYDAIRRGNIRDVEVLLKAGADVNDVPPEHWTPLMVAAEFDNVAIARLLLDSGADVNRAGSCGYTALQLAVDGSLDGAWQTMRDLGAATTEMVSLLLERGASVSAVDYQGETALDLAARYGPNKILDLLRSWQEHLKSQQGGAPSAGTAEAPPKSLS